MDNQTFNARYGYPAPVQQFKGGARAGIIVAAILSALATLVVILINTIAVLPYYGTGTLGVTHFLPLIAAALMVIMAGVAKPKSKIVLALPATVWLVNRGIVAVVTFSAMFTVNVSQTAFISNAATLVYAIAVALLMWLVCAGAIKNGTVCGVIVTVTAVIGFFVVFGVNFFGLLQVIYYDSYGAVLLAANIFSAAAGMLFYIANAAALFMVGSKPKAQPYYYTTQQPYYPAQPTYPQQNYPQPTYPQQTTYPPTAPAQQPPVQPTQTDNNTEVK